MRVVIRGMLTKEQVKRGYRVIEVDDHFVELRFGKNIVGVFSAEGVKDWALRREADNHWAGLPAFLRAAPQY